MTDRTSLPGFVLPWRQMKIVRWEIKNGGQNGSEKNGKGPNGNDFYLFQISIGLICHKLIKSFEC